MTSLVNYDINYVVQISTSTRIYISINYCSLLSCTPFEILCFGPVDAIAINQVELTYFTPCIFQYSWFLNIGVTKILGL